MNNPSTPSARRKARRPLTSGDVETLNVPDEELAPLDDLPGDVRDEIMAAIEALPEHYRPVVVLRYGQGLAVKDISRSLGVPVGTVVSQVFRANRILRTKLRHLVADQ